MKLRKYLLLLITAITMVICSCKKDISHDDDNGSLKNLVGTIEIPVGLNYENIEIYSEVDKSVVTTDSKFQLNSYSVVFAQNNSRFGHPIYFGMPGIGQKNFVLDAKETALYFSLLAFPHIRHPYFKQIITEMKTALYTFEEVKQLEAEIKQIVNTKGYLDYDLLGPHIGKAVDKMIRQFELVYDPSILRTSASWDDTYSAGKGYFRVSSKVPDGWVDKTDTNTGENILKREFFNTTSAVVGVRIEDYDKSREIVPLPLKYKYIGFLEPWFPPNVMTISGNVENVKSWWQATKDMWKEGPIDGMKNTDAYSASNEFEFKLNPNMDKAFVFTNGALDPMMTGLNVLYFFLDNMGDLGEVFGSVREFERLGILNDYMKWMVESNSVSLMNIAVWGRDKEYDKIGNELAETLFQFIKEEKIPLGSFKSSAELDEKFKELIVKLSGSVGVVAKYSIIGLKAASQYILSSDEKFSAAIPIEQPELVSFDWDDNKYTLLRHFNKKDYRNNPDGTKFFKASLILNISNGQSEQNVTLSDDVYLSDTKGAWQRPSIYVEDAKKEILVFINSKETDRYYGMAGYVFNYSVSKKAVKTETVFNNANYGWYSFFEQSKDINLRFFSFAGYSSFKAERNMNAQWNVINNGHQSPESAEQDALNHRQVVFSHK